jgi:hypothetical protein
LDTVPEPSAEALRAVMREPSEAGNRFEPSSRTRRPAALKLFPCRVTEPESRRALGTRPTARSEASRFVRFEPFSGGRWPAPLRSTRLSAALNTLPLRVTEPESRPRGVTPVPLPVMGAWVTTVPATFCRFEPSRPGSFPSESSRTSWLAPLKLFPCRVTEAPSSRALGTVPEPSAEAFSPLRFAPSP